MFPYLFPLASPSPPPSLSHPSRWSQSTELARLEPVLRNKRGCDSERPAHRDEEWPPLTATRERLEDMGRGKGKLGENERVAWTYIHYQT